MKFIHSFREIFLWILMLCAFNRKGHDWHYGWTDEWQGCATIGLSGCIATVAILLIVDDNDTLNRLIIFNHLYHDTICHRYHDLSPPFYSRHNYLYIIINYVNFFMGCILYLSRIYPDKKRSREASFGWFSEAELIEPIFEMIVSPWLVDPITLKGNNWSCPRINPKADIALGIGSLITVTTEEASFFIKDFHPRYGATIFEHLYLDCHDFGPPICWYECIMWVFCFLSMVEDPISTPCTLLLITILLKILSLFEYFFEDLIIGH